MKFNNLNIGILGLGYVGLPLFLEFSKKLNVVGFDTNKQRINELNKCVDSNNEFNIDKKTKYFFTFNHNELDQCNVYIITVPTPVTKNNLPDFNLLKKATTLIAQKIKKNDLIIYESTVYPGAVEEICAPIIEKISKLILNIDFYLGYSPERINPGDNKHTLINIKKITSGSNYKASIFVDKLYKKIIKAGTHRVSSIRIAEAAKVIENCQRDINIAFVNELSIIFNKMNLNTNEILEAAGTKWNFLKFKPGLVGGHCISIDPYYLSYISKKIGHIPKIILAGREINNSIPQFIIDNILKKLKLNSIERKNAKALILGLSFKENCNDVRNSKIIEIYNKLSLKIKKVDIYDPLVDKKYIFKNYKLKINKSLKYNYYDVVIIAVAHDYFKEMGLNKIKKFINRKGIVFDLKNIYKDESKNINWSL